MVAHFDTSNSCQKIYVLLNQYLSSAISIDRIKMSLILHMPVSMPCLVLINTQSAHSNPFRYPTNIILKFLRPCTNECFGRFTSRI